MSLFDGSGGFPLVASMCGITPVMASEIEPYPIAVTRSRFPDMKHLGDVSKINGAKIEPVDVITFGSPYQDMSIAGKRAGIKHEQKGDKETTRSGLFMEAVRIIKEMREATNGEYPTFAVWENVPGAFSSNKGEDFKTVLEELVKIAEPQAPALSVPKGGWSSADILMGDGWSIAYRVIDAQYWGVPQRRKRIYLVADFRGQRAGKILFERKSLHGYFEKGRTPWQGTASDVGESVETANQDNGIVLNDQGGQQITVHTDGKAPTLRAEMHGNIPCVIENSSLKAAGFKDKAGAKSGSIGFEQEKSPTILESMSPSVLIYDARGNGDGETAPTITGDHNNRVTDYTACIVAKDVDTITLANETVTGTLMARDYKGVGRFDTLNKIVCKKQNDSPKYIVRRLTPTECARLQGFPDKWGHPDPKTDFTDAEYYFWQDVRNTHAVINGETVKEHTKAQMLTWYNKLHTDSAEYKMWGNGIALPTALYVMQGIQDVLYNEVDL